MYALCVCVCVYARPHSVVSDSVTPWTVAHQAPPSWTEAKILEWVAISFCRGSSWSRDRAWVLLRLLHWQAVPWWLRMVKNLPAVWENWLQSVGWEDPLEKGMATHSSVPAWKIPWTEDPGRLQSMGSQRVRHDWVAATHSLFTSWATREALIQCVVCAFLPSQSGFQPPCIWPLSLFWAEESSSNHDLYVWCLAALWDVSWDTETATS